MDLFCNDDDEDSFDDEFAIGDDDPYEDDEGDARATSSAEPSVRNLHPRFAEKVFGQSVVEQMMLRQWQEDKLPSALMFTGQRGIGKATMAYRLACFLLEKGMRADAVDEAPSLFGDALPPVRPTSLNVVRDCQTVRHVLAGSHADLLVLEPEWDDKRGRQKTDISIEQTRRIGEFLSYRPVEAACKLVLIDSVDALNVSSSNSILKWLEEPPHNSMFILISHRPGALLPTIRSRCRMVGFAPLELPVFSSIIQDLGVRGDAEELHDLYALAGGSAGIAMHLHTHGVGEWLQAVQDVLHQAPKFPLREVMAVAEMTGRGGENTLDWDDVSMLLSGLLARVVRRAASDQQGWAQEDLLEPKQSLVETLARQRPLRYWLEQWDAMGALLHETGRLHLDKTQTMMRVMEALMGRRSLV